MTLTVYTKNNCQACRATKKFLTKNNIEYTEINIDLPENQEHKEYLLDEGWLSLPVIYSPQGLWSGYRPELLEKLI